MNLTVRPLLATACLVASAFTWSSVSAQDTVQIGAILSLTGVNATVGEDVRRAVDLAVDKVNENGGVLGKKFAVIIEDSAGNPTTAISAARKLATVDKVPVVLGEYSSGITLPMAQYLVKEGVTHINIASTSVKIRELGTSSFNLIGLEDIGNKFSSADVYSQGMHKIAIIAPNNAYGQGVAHGFRVEYEKLGGKILTEVLYTAGQSSYRRELQQMARSQPDGYVYTAYGHESAIINREAFELGLRKQPWYAILLTNSLSDTPADIAQGQIGMEVGSYEGPVGEAYAQAFAAKYKEPMKTSYTGYAYDGVMLAAAAINKAQSTKSTNVQAALNELGKTGFQGVTGMIKLDQDRQRLDPPYAKLKYDGGKVVRR
ncbi:ABC transporter substrate-binding protein [Alcaligenaceae bacterium CGII-47]|nr:ABC transporter substrate-binding protein [Alcaligenaceae bacterium CGII-47]